MSCVYSRLLAAAVHPRALSCSTTSLLLSSSLSTAARIAQHTRLSSNTMQAATTLQHYNTSITITCQHTVLMSCYSHMQALWSATGLQLASSHRQTMMNREMLSPATDGSEG